jgi:hypothetical protein
VRIGRITSRQKIMKLGGRHKERMYENEYGGSFHSHI